MLTSKEERTRRWEGRTSTEISIGVSVEKMMILVKRYENGNIVYGGIVAHNTTGKALAMFDETGDQNILVASASGVTQATLSRTGDLTLVGDLAVNGDTITSDGDLVVTPTGTLTL